ncbi:MAG: LamG domain protein jellyroll fold domain protein [Pedosphaera sp.]|nr:LamG domain protein jellyroll fold domain protein [Pedosphaera sp.]
MLIAVALLLFLAPALRAAITEADYWRMGENDPSNKPGAATFSTDPIGGRTLNLAAGPLYATLSSSSAIASTGSTSCMEFLAGAYGLASLIPSVTNNFGVELWVNPTNTSQNACLFYNGNSANSGWGIFQSGATCQGALGGVGYVGSGTLAAGTWTHVALVVNNGTATLYINGVAAGSSVNAMANPPTGTYLGMGADPVNTSASHFSGYLDEVRVFTFAAGQFSVNDLLINAGAPNATSGSASNLYSTGATLNGTVNPNGLDTTYSVRYGTSTNYTKTNSASLAASKSTNGVSIAVTGLSFNTLYHYQFVAANSAGASSGADNTFTTTQVPTIIANSQVVGWLASATPTNGLTVIGISSGPTNFVVVQNPTNGNLVQLPGFGTNGLWQYIPSVTNGVDVDGFTFYASDAYGEMSTVATVSIMVTNLPYAFNATVGWLPNNFSTNALAGLVAGAATNFSIYQYPANGQVILQPGFSTNGLWSYQPFTTNFSGADSFLFRVADSNGNYSLPGLVSITITNLPYAYSQSVSWLRGTTPTYTLKGIVASGVPNFLVLQGPTNGTLTQLTGFGTNGYWQYQPTNSITNSGPDTFTFAVKDNLGNTSAAALVSIFVTNVPYANSQSVGWLKNQFPTNQLTGIVASGTTNFAIAKNPLYGQVVQLAGFNTNGLWQYQPYGTNFWGTDSFTFTVSNNASVSLPGLISITVTNVPVAPYAHFQYLKTRPGQALPITLSGDDDGNDPTFPTNVTQNYAHTRDMREWNPTFTVLSNPTNGTLTGTAPNLTYTPSQSNVFDSFTFKVNNGFFDSPPATVMIKVAAYNIGTNYFSTNFSLTPGNTNHATDVPLVNAGTVRPGFEGWALSTTNGTVADSGGGWSASTGRGDDTDILVTNFLDRLKRNRLFKFYGNQFTNFYINNNGLLSFGGGIQSYVSQPFPTAPSLGPIVAPLWCDVDTRATNRGGLVTYGMGYVSDNFRATPALGRPALIITWNDVAAYNELTNSLNRFQVVLIDRSDLRTGDFDVEFNYEYIEWLSGSATTGQYPGAGFDAGDGTHYYNLPNAKTTGVTNYVTTSNTIPALPGRFMFRLNPDFFLTSVASVAATNIGTTNAFLSVLINPGGIFTPTWFVLTNTTLGTMTNIFAGNIPSGTTTAVPIGVNVGNLLAGCSYGVSVLASNEYIGPTANGVTFTTIPRLSSLTLSAGALTPAFDPSITGYICQVSNAPSINVAVTAENTTASLSYQINGGGYPYFVTLRNASFPFIPLHVGVNPLNVKIQAMDGTENIYTVNVILAPSTDSSLAVLGINQGMLAPVFDPATLAYTAAVSNGVANLTLSAGTTFSNATLQINGGAAVTNTNSVTIPLALGTNTLPIVVTAEDGVTMTTYTLTVVRAAGPPMVALQPVSGITHSNGTLNAQVTPNGAATTVYFLWGANSNYGTTNIVAIGSASTAVPVSDLISNLFADTVYHYQIIGSNSSGTTASGDQTFTTLAGPPVVVTIGVTNISATNATLLGTVNPAGAATGWYFEYGLTTNHGSATVTNLLALGNTAVSVSNTISGLSPGTAYHFFVTATNSLGTNSGGDMSFVSLDIPRTISNVYFSAPGQLTLQFTGGPGINYTVLTSTNLELPLSSWTSLGAPTILSNNLYQFTDSNATNALQYYTLKH